VHMAETIGYLSARGIPVMSHIGMTPQAINTIGSFAPRGRLRSEWAEFEADAKAVAESGAFAVVLEALAELLAVRITKQIAIPTIGIGASAECDGQILVLEDMLGLSPRVPKFVKEYAQIGAGIEGAVKAFANEVRARTFPSTEYTYPMFEEGPEVTKKTKMTGS
jgi:3-methyl-2-oxobutanoate hydroxymethyltransferase